MTESDVQDRFRSFDPAKLGRFGETLWAKVFESSGFSFIPLHRIETGESPALEGARRVTLPDFDIAGEGLTAFVDSKAKKTSALFRNADEVRHGIDRQSWAAYVDAAITMRKNCGLAIVELFGPSADQWSGGLLAESFLNLGTPIQGFSTQAHMVYWPRKRFVDLDTWSATELLAIVRGQKRVSYRRELTAIFGPSLGCRHTWDCDDPQGTWVTEQIGLRQRVICEHCKRLYGYRAA